MAFKGVDLRDLYRSGSGLSPRRLMVLVRALPADAPLWSEIQVAAEKAEEQRKVEKLRERTAYYKRRKEVAQ